MTYRFGSSKHTRLCLGYLLLIEDAIHYFFHCRKFTLERQVFNDTVRVFQPLSIDMILCGNFNLNMENNIVLFRAVHRYIHATKRFKTS